MFNTWQAPTPQYEFLFLNLRFPLEKRIKEKIVGQEGAVTTVAAAIRRKGKAFLQPTPAFFGRFAAIEDGEVAA